MLYIIMLNLRSYHNCSAVDEREAVDGLKKHKKRNRAVYFALGPTQRIQVRQATTINWYCNNNSWHSRWIFDHFLLIIHIIRLDSHVFNGSYFWNNGSWSFWVCLRFIYIKYGCFPLSSATIWCFNDNEWPYTSTTPWHITDWYSLFSSNKSMNFRIWH